MYDKNGETSSEYLRNIEETLVNANLKTFSSMTA